VLANCTCCFISLLGLSFHLSPFLIFLFLCAWQHIRDMAWCWIIINSKWDVTERAWVVCYKCWLTCKGVRTAHRCDSTDLQNTKVLELELEVFCSGWNCLQCAAHRSTKYFLLIRSSSNQKRHLMLSSFTGWQAMGTAGLSYTTSSFDTCLARILPQRKMTHQIGNPFLHSPITPVQQAKQLKFQ